MKKLPTLRGKQWAGKQGLAVLGLVGLMLMVSYLGTLGAHPVSLTLPSERIPIEGAAIAEEATASPEPASAPEATPAPDAAATAVPAATATAAVGTAGFEGYRQRLAATRETSAALLDEVIGSASASADTVQEALRQKAELARAAEVETTIETLLSARGFEALCTVRQGSVQIVVAGEQLTQQQAAQILDIAVSESGEAATNVKIIPAG